VKVSKAGGALRGGAERNLRALGPKFWKRWSEEGTARVTAPEVEKIYGEEKKRTENWKIRVERKKKIKFGVGKNGRIPSGKSRYRGGRVFGGGCTEKTSKEREIRPWPRKIQQRGKGKRSQKSRFSSMGAEHAVSGRKRPKEKPFPPQGLLIRSTPLLEKKQKKLKKKEDIVVKVPLGGDQIITGTRKRGRETSRIVVINFGQTIGKERGQRGKTSPSLQFRKLAEGGGGPKTNARCGNDDTLKCRARKKATKGDKRANYY